MHNNQKSIEFEKIFFLMILRDVVDAGMAATKLNQTDFGAKIGAAQSMVSRMRKGDDWEEHWQIFLKLTALCDSLGIDYADDGKENSGKTRLSDAKHHRQKTRSTSQAGKNGLEAEIISAISTRRTLLRPGKGKPGR